SSSGGVAIPVAEGEAEVDPQPLLVDVPRGGVGLAQAHPGGVQQLGVRVDAPELQPLLPERHPAEDLGEDPVRLRRRVAQPAHVGPLTAPPAPRRGSGPARPPSRRPAPPSPAAAGRTPASSGRTGTTARWPAPSGPPAPRSPPRRGTAPSSSGRARTR